MKRIFTDSPRLNLNSGAAAVLAGFVAMAFQPARADVPSLGFSSYASAYGGLNTQYSSPLLGQISFNLNGPTDYKYNPQWMQDPNTGLWSQIYSNTTGIASASYTIPAAAAVTDDALYSFVTSNGQYGFSYSVSAEAAGLALKTKAAVRTVDASGNRAYSPTTSMYSSAYASWNQKIYIESTTEHPAGSYGAILVGFTLEGNFSVPLDAGLYGYAYADDRVSSTFTDSSGVDFTSQYSINANYWDPNWNGTTTVFKKLLFQYGTPFSLEIDQQAYAGRNGIADFFNTGFISSIELPFGATLNSGAQQAGLGTAAQLFGHVSNAATLDDPNTNWDFANKGGGFIPPSVPEPSAWALMLAGLLSTSRVARRNVLRGRP